MKTKCIRERRKVTARGNQEHPNRNISTQKEQIKTYFVSSHPVGHYVNMTFCSSCYQTGGCRNSLFRHFELLSEL